MDSVISQPILTKCCSLSLSWKQFKTWAQKEIFLMEWDFRSYFNELRMAFLIASPSVRQNKLRETWTMFSYRQEVGCSRALVVSARGTERLLLMALVKVIYQLNLFSSVFLLALTEFSLLRYCSLHDECMLLLPATCACRVIHRGLIDLKKTTSNNGLVRGCFRLIKCH